MFYKIIPYKYCAHGAYTKPLPLWIGELKEDGVIYLAREAAAHAENPIEDDVAFVTIEIYSPDDLQLKWRHRSLNGN